ncbi:hypothetical protein BR63_03540 [Thermanaerosceptrum fracticalcis]|uniref:Uncharacterized protein n=1 Tax=Thermanaerosceptrum fracticalcis TaxID=1712410 RepID=A0A7G6E066_THEFR|nr:hypothetical protein [Thermanaerosceptrum fracticalcis]QNB45470.1 hypothetical protein BR63_03540 [Thermanaerosceptrum fracticalcis]
MSAQNLRWKTQIYFSRSYRHLKPNSKEQLFFLLWVVLPSLIIFLFFYTKISYLLAVWIKEALSLVIPVISLGIGYGEFLPLFGGVYYVQIPSKMPSFQEVTTNLVVTLLLLFICFFLIKSSKRGTPLLIYFAIILLIHLVAGTYFMFAKDSYPYSATQYSELYIQQQVGIWLSFLVLSGLITGILGYGSLKGRLVVFFGTMAYSFIFGCVRYLVSIFIVSKASSLYMASLFFSLGPMFDFLYLVCFYSIYINQQIKRLGQGEGRAMWHWL